jgi:Fe-S cluster assembly ATP-binding protein
MSAGGAGHSVLRVSGLRAGVAGKEILQGIDLEVRSGEVHAVMGPNGSGKSTLAHVLMGRPGYEVLGGSATLDGVELLGLHVWERAKEGLFLALQYPVEVPGVSLAEMLAEGLLTVGRADDAEQGGLGELLQAEAGRIGLDARLLDRAVNVDLSGGEKKRLETLQLAVLRPKIAVLDEIDSGLDVDALRAVAHRVRAATEVESIGVAPLGVLAITHYSRLLHELPPDVIHVMVRGRVVATGGPELAAELERTGYSAYGVDEPAASAAPGT